MSRETIAYRLTCDDCGHQEDFWNYGPVTPPSQGWNKDPTLQCVTAHNLAKDMCASCTTTLRNRRALENA